MANTYIYCQVRRTSGTLVDYDLREAPSFTEGFVILREIGGMNRSYPAGNVAEIAWETRPPSPQNEPPRR